MKMLCACAIALLVLVGAIAPAQAWTCLPVKSIVAAPLP